MYFSFLKRIPRERSSFDYKTAHRSSKYLTNLHNTGLHRNIIKFIYLQAVAG